MRNTNSKVIEKRDTTSFTLQDTSQGVMTQNEARDERKRQEKEERMKAYTEIQIKKLNMEEAIKRRKLDMEAIQVKKFEIEAINQTKKQKRWHFFS
ncbi:ABC transporter C family member 3 [Hordeum vulgare]|nr:ABC transporter C family member 3 [Hordeum vulgare]